MPVHNLWVLDLIAQLNTSLRLYRLAQEGMLHGRSAIVVDCRSVHNYQLTYCTTALAEQSDFDPERKRALLDAIASYDPTQYAVVCAICPMDEGNDELFEVVTTMVKLPLVDRN
jgi:hypothetical protein